MVIYNPPIVDDDTPTAGEFVPPRDAWISAVSTGASGQLTLSYFTARRSETITTITAYTGTTAAAATPTTCLLGVYQEAANGDLTLVATTTNDTTLFAASGTEYSKALASSWSKLRGVRYATAVLVISGGTMPTYLAHQPGLNANPVYNAYAVAPRKTGRLTGQTGTTLPASITAGSVVANSWRPAMRLS